LGIRVSREDLNAASCAHKVGANFRLPLKPRAKREALLFALCSSPFAFKIGWGGWIRTNECRFQRPVPYHLATPQYLIAFQERSKLRIRRFLFAKDNWCVQAFHNK